MKSPAIYIVSESGQKLSGPVFLPFFQTVLPALQNKADEIWIKAAKSGVSAEYVRNSKTVPLKLHEEFHPCVISSRIRIASGMSIEPTELQTGNMKIIFEKQRALTFVKITTIGGAETLAMTLMWN